jgi:hypothetical protein
MPLWNSDPSACKPVNMDEHDSYDDDDDDV